MEPVAEAIAEYVVHVELTDDLIRSASRRRLLRQMGRGFVVLSAVVWSGCLVAYLTQIGWLAIIFATLGIMIAALTLNAYWRAPREAGKPYVGLGNRTITYRFNAEGYSIESGLGKARCHWKLLGRVDEWPDVWLLIQKDNRALILPVDQVDDGLAQLLRQKVPGKPIS